jgi:nucleotide-binding universal stress UspA family protein
MAYKSIFTSVSLVDGGLPELNFAVAMAAAQDGHLDVLCLGVDRTPTAYYEMGTNAVLMHAAIEEAHARATEIRQKVDAYMAAAEVRWEAFNTVATGAGVGRMVAGQARFCDLAVVRQPYSEHAAPEDILVTEGLLFETDCPVVIVPATGTASPRPDRIVIGWDESKEAMRAVRTALPLLRSATSVEVVIIDPPETGPERSDPGGALAVYLSRHGIHCDIQVMTRQGQRISERLSQHVTETGAELLVMGGYGHSRFREAVLGGATRDMLEHATVPVLMAH